MMGRPRRGHRHHPPGHLTKLHSSGRLLNTTLVSSGETRALPAGDQSQGSLSRAPYRCRPRASLHDAITPDGGCSQEFVALVLHREVDVVDF